MATELFETVVKLPVTVQPLYGGAHQGEMVLTHFKPQGDGPFPAVVMQHGRDGNQRATPARYRYTDVVRYWVRRGVAVFVPTRVGYGDSGMTVDPEFTGDCDKKNYDVAAAATNVQTLATIDFATKQPWVLPNKVLVMGQSMGGFATVVAMGAKHPSVVAGINFAGGGGGDPVNRKANPCGYHRLANTFEKAGKANGGSTPMLWLYAENDNYWGADIPRKWHQAYTGAGGKAEFAAFGPVSPDGHGLLAKGMPLWRPVLDQFIATLGISPPKATGAPPASGFAAIDDASKLPRVRQDVKDTGYPRFLNADLPRAMAIGPKGEWAFFSGDNVIQRSLDRCAQTAKTACKLYAVDDNVVWMD
ncbi:dienelactone hydrolase family protein [uncultured Rhodoferax sp.]|uniref:dienelactone hydrolase family protein n=1 Tax=uncultured Rhodoferax sp. TaxID=223188 RepID=UPI0025F8E97B|nr:dienelactone hydrolase family protein [uncultured Rhodoferax sp.]